MEKKKKNMFLFVVGIILIVVSSFGLLFGTIGFFGIEAATRYMASLINVDINFSLMKVSAIIGLIGTGIGLATGILGVVNAAKPEKANICIIFGVSMIVVSIMASVVQSIAGYPFNLITLIIGQTLPVLYLIGAVQNKESGDVGVNEEEPINRIEY